MRTSRSEAKGVPNLLVAPKLQDEGVEDGYETSREGYYADGAYTARVLSPLPEKVSASEIDPQDAYYAALIQRFQDTASQLRRPAVTPTLDLATIDLLKILVEASYKTWRSQLLSQPPRPTLLYGLPQEAVLKGLEVLSSLLKGTKRDDFERWKKIGAWAWALLARCRDVCEMSSEEVSACRDFGKEAAWVLRIGHVAAAEEPSNPNGQGREDEHEESESITSTGVGDGTPMLEQESVAEVPIGPFSTSGGCVTNSINGGIQDSASMTLDMIITIVGELYGQRDLLEARIIWGEDVG